MGNYNSLSYELSQNIPNPFSESTKIKYKITETSKVNVDVYNKLGEKVDELVNEVQDAGSYEIKWNAQSVSAGVYFCRMQVNDFIAVRKMKYEK